MNRKGFSLLECLVALLILLVGILGLCPLFISSPRYNQSAYGTTEAATLAQSKFEELKLTGWDTIVTSQDTITGSTGTNFTRRWQVTNNGLSKTVLCTISWRDWTDHEVQFFTAYCL
jgi:prepilin-type N-terminal cleavage/methylation domain-containing protein